MAAVYQKQPDLDQQDLEAGDFKPAAIASANDPNKVQPYGEEKDAATMHFEASVRLGFLRKVFGILTVQMFMTVAVSALFMLNKGVQTYVIAHRGFMTLGFIGSFVLLFALFAKKDEHPLNLQLLGAWTLCQAYTIGVVCATYAAHGAGAIVLQAAVLTLLVFCSLTAYTLQTKRDFSFMGGALFSGLLIMLGWGFMNAILGIHSSMYSLFGALLFCLFIIYDVQMTMNKIGVDDYILAVINLYLDIVNLFLFILDLLSQGDRR